jgi:uncharacterized protein YkwD
MLVLATIIFQSLFAPASTEPVKPVVTNAIPYEKVNKELLLQLVNIARSKGVKCGDKWHPPVPPLTWNQLLEKAAVDHSKDMFNKNYFSHIAGDGSTANSRIEKAGYIWMAYGENIGYGYRSEKEVVAAWLTSPGHCANIMSKNFKEMGVGRAGNYWTQDFGSK